MCLQEDYQKRKKRGKKMIESHEVILVDNFIFNIKLILSPFTSLSCKLHKLALTQK